MCKDPWTLAILLEQEFIEIIGENDEGATYTWLKTISSIPLSDNFNMFIKTDFKDDTRVTLMNWQEEYSLMR